jgi:hypothetical protein
LATVNWQLSRRVLVEERERRRLVVAGLHFELVEVDCLAVEARRGAGLEAAEF